MAADSALIDILLSSEISGQSVRKTVSSYYEKFSSKISKGSTLTAADAKKDAPTIIKIVNSCMKQVRPLFNLLPAFVRRTDSCFILIFCATSKAIPNVIAW
jgi:hypothetical protein